MDRKTDYAVIRFLEQGGSCYQVSDIIQGMTIIQCVKEKKEITGRTAICIFEGILLQLQQLYKMQDMAYGYVNPCAVIIDDDNQVYFADVLSKDNIDLVKRMQKKSFREKFMSQDGVNRGEPEKVDDLYGTAKVMQFLLDRATFQEKLSKLEKNKIQRLIKKCLCSDGVEEDEVLEEVLLELKGNNTNYFLKHKKESFYAIVFLITFLAIGGSLFQRETRKEPEPTVLGEEEIKVDLEEKKELLLELSLLYFSENQDYLEMRSVLEKIRKESELAQIYLELLDYLQNGGEIAEEKWNYYFEKSMKEWEALQVLEDVKYRLPLLEACRMNNTTDRWKLVRTMGKELADKASWNHVKEERIVRSYLGEAYVVLEEREEAVKQYVRLKEITTDIPELEKIYLKLLFLYSKVEPLEEGKKLMNELIQEAIVKIPSISENSEFIKMQEFCATEAVHSEEVELEEVPNE